MQGGFRLRQAVVEEGKALILITDPEEAIIDGKFEPTRLKVFYNPLMEFNRDLSVIALQAYIDLYAPHRPVKILEPLSATGVRGIRYALELENVDEVIINDLNSLSLMLMNRNVQLNGVEGKVKIFNKDASSLMHYLHRERPTPISIVDLDPYGSPAPFADAALSLLGHKGLFAATATDLAVLGGSKKWKALKRYWVKLADVPQKKEVAVRVLLGYLAKIAAAHDKVIKPLLSYYADHYIRVYALVERNASKAAKLLDENLGYMTYCRWSGKAFLAPEPDLCSTTGDKGVLLGPLWIGNFADITFIEYMTKLFRNKFSYLNTSKRIGKLLNLLIEEAPLQNNVYQYVPRIASKVADRLPRLSELLECLKDKGFEVSRTHFDPMGIRTSASHLELTLCIQKALEGKIMKDSLN